MKYRLFSFKVFALLVLMGFAGCQTSPTNAIEEPPPTVIQSPTIETIIPATKEPEETLTMIPEQVQPAPDKPLADVISVETTGEPNQYSFSVGISSPDTGCEQYADWWEVITPQGELLYRRILLHSHVAEQPFVRSGGLVEIKQDTEVIIRAHMNPGGYGGKAFRGSVASGFIETDLADDFMVELEDQDPLPSGCNF
jgi:hypothetical protein